MIPPIDIAIYPPSKLGREVGHIPLTVWDTFGASLPALADAPSLASRRSHGIAPVLSRERRGLMELFIGGPLGPLL